jgi:hypothetical protein
MVASRFSITRFLPDSAHAREPNLNSYDAKPPGTGLE